MRYSIFIRTVCGILGIGGLAAIEYQAVRDGGIQPDFLLFAKLFAGFVFLYVAIFAESPLGITFRHRR